MIDHASAEARARVGRPFATQRIERKLSSSRRGGSGSHDEEFRRARRCRDGTFADILIDQGATLRILDA
jgi:hypothetical protein